MKNPDEHHNCLLVYPKFSQFSFWNTQETVQALGAKATAPPLGLITVASLMPQTWTYKLLDLNTEEFNEELWEWADIILAGGMLPQQKGLLEVIQHANKTGKFIAVGGPDPTSQPDIYQNADALVMGEGETTIPLWMEAWRNGRPSGRYHSPDKPDVTQSPMPKYELLKFEDYGHIGIQYARGCPFNCEFCDIIELYGRKPRTKNPEQFLAELQRVYELGYRGYVEIVDDNFIGNKRNVKRHLLPALIEWNNKRWKPFYFGTEASMNLGDDEKLLEQMRKAEFRYVFMGIETPDPDLLLQTQKTQNTVRPIADRVKKVYEYGILVTAGFIIGFDNEKKGTDKSLIKCIEDTGICMAMVGLLVALPNTQLTRRLIREKRLLSFEGKQVNSSEDLTKRASTDASIVDVVDQTLAGLNFITTRDRKEIYDELCATVSHVYSPKSYFDRILRTVRDMPYRAPRLARPKESRRQLRAMAIMMWKHTKDKETRWLFWRNFFCALILGLHRFEHAMTLAAVYLHFRKQSRYLVNVLQGYKANQDTVPQQLEKGKKLAPAFNVS